MTAIDFLQKKAAVITGMPRVVTGSTPKLSNVGKKLKTSQPKNNSSFVNNVGKGVAIGSVPVLGGGAILAAN